MTTLKEKRKNLFDTWLATESDYKEVVKKTGVTVQSPHTEEEEEATRERQEELSLGNRYALERALRRLQDGRNLDVDPIEDPKVQSQEEFEKMMESEREMKLMETLFEDVTQDHHRPSPRASKTPSLDTPRITITSPRLEDHRKWHDQTIRLRASISLPLLKEKDKIPRLNNSAEDNSRHNRDEDRRVISKTESPTVQKRKTTQETTIRFSSKHLLWLLVLVVLLIQYIYAGT
ncbi:hypothetical protein PROFUN_06254 [Planoprotostelium fungivorum]|uniref:Uncharacterized protein n=1 Tax=Planoprotostelium fungivorum TaxID=1890364 RepID=A0A2P6NE89_9EUKA|nr:hypothetical protein PROFUN_06254 [Planoprotostelium fungivorum]